MEEESIKYFDHYLDLITNVEDIYKFSSQQKTQKCLDKNYNIFQKTRFDHTMIFFSDIYTSLHDSSWTYVT